MSGVVQIRSRTNRIHLGKQEIARWFRVSQKYLSPNLRHFNSTNSFSRSNEKHFKLLEINGIS